MFRLGIPWRGLEALGSQSHQVRVRVRVRVRASVRFRLLEIFLCHLAGHLSVTTRPDFTLGNFRPHVGDRPIPVPSPVPDLLPSNDRDPDST